MDVLFLISAFRLYPGLKMTFEQKSVRKKPISKCSKCMFLLEFWTFFTWDGPKIYVWWTHWLWKFLFGLCISLLQSIQTTRNTAWCCWSSASTKWQRIWLLLHDWTRTKFMFAWSRDWTTLLPLRKTPSTLHFQLCRFLKQYVLHCTSYRGNWEKNK